MDHALRLVEENVLYISEILIVIESLQSKLSDLISAHFSKEIQFLCNREN
jgi:hypothetical protein